MFTEYPTVIVRDDGAQIPRDESNTDYRVYLEWVEAGNVPGSPPQPTVAELILKAQTEMRAQRQPIIEVLSSLQASALTNGDLAMAQTIETAKQALLDITQLPLYTCTTYEQMKAMTMARYIQIAGASPALKAAFSEALK